MPESTRTGISAASHGARPKQSACAMPNLGLDEYQKLDLSRKTLAVPLYRKLNYEKYEAKSTLLYQPG